MGTDRRRARTRRALIDAAQELIADGQVHASIATITARARIGLGSFYNHFDSREALFREAAADAVERLAGLLDQLGPEEGDAAEAVARSFRLAVRLHRSHPEMSKVILSTGPAGLASDAGMASRLRRDLSRGAVSRRLDIGDLEVAVMCIAGAALALGHLVQAEPTLDAAAAADEACAYLLRLLGLPDAEARRIANLPLPDLPVLERRRISWSDVQ